MRSFNKLRKYWTLKPPVYLKHQTNWNGVSITPEHEQKRVLNKIEDDDIIVITPIHEETKGSITRTFGDVLCDEMII